MWLILLSYFFCSHKDEVNTLYGLLDVRLFINTLVTGTLLYFFTSLFSVIYIAYQTQVIFDNNKFIYHNLKLFVLFDKSSCVYESKLCYDQGTFDKFLLSWNFFKEIFGFFFLFVLFNLLFMTCLRFF